VAFLKSCGRFFFVWHIICDDISIPSFRNFYFLGRIVLVSVVNRWNSNLGVMCCSVGTDLVPDIWGEIVWRNKTSRSSIPLVSLATGIFHVCCPILRRASNNRLLSAIRPIFPELRIRPNVGRFGAEYRMAGITSTNHFLSKNLIFG